MERRDRDALLRERRERRDERRDREARERVEEPVAKASYFLATFSVFARWQTGEVRVSVDDEIRGGRMRDVIIANCRYFGGGMMICPEAEPDDGVLDALLIGDITKTDLALTLPKIYRGTHLPHPKAELLKGKPSASTRACRCQSSWTESSPGPRPSGSKSCRGRCAARAASSEAVRLLRCPGPGFLRRPACRASAAASASSRAHPPVARAP